PGAPRKRYHKLNLLTSEICMHILRAKSLVNRFIGCNCWGGAIPRCCTDRRMFSMKRAKFVVGVLAGLVFSLASASVTFAQYRASIQGTVTDTQGGAVSGATVTLTNHETNQTLTATTDDGGIYNFAGLPPSVYTLTVEKPGFKKRILNSVGVIA